MIKKIKEAWERISRAFRNTYRFAQRLYDYLPVLWNDRDWDWLFLIYLLEKKLERMSKELKKGHGVNSERHSEELHVLALICRRIVEDKYDEIPRRKMDEKYGELRFRSEPTGRAGFSKLIIDREGAPYGSKEAQIERKETLRIGRAADEAMQRDIVYLFDTLKKKLRSYWD